MRTDARRQQLPDGALLGVVEHVLEQLDGRDGEGEVHALAVPHYDGLGRRCFVRPACSSKLEVASITDEIETQTGLCSRFGCHQREVLCSACWRWWTGPAPRG